MKNNLHLDQMVHQLKFNYLYLRDLVKDIDEKNMAHTPAKGLENHPAFTIGHIITAYGMTTKLLGGKYTVKKEWNELFRRNGPGDLRYPTDIIALYPNKKELITELNNQHEMLLGVLAETTIQKLNKIVEWRFSKYFPKTIDLIYFMSITHYALHISQLAAWRRAMNLPSALARL